MEKIYYEYICCNMLHINVKHIMMLVIRLVAQLLQIIWFTVKEKKIVNHRHI